MVNGGFLRMNNLAFTLVELIVVVLVVATLVAVAVPVFRDRSEDARKAAARVDLKALESAMEMYRTDWHAYPSNGGADQPVATLRGFLLGTHMTRMNVYDPWGKTATNEYHWKSDGDTYVIWSGAGGSRGPDGPDTGDLYVPGGLGE